MKPLLFSVNEQVELFKKTVSYVQTCLRTLREDILSGSHEDFSRETAEFSKQLAALQAKYNK